MENMQNSSKNHKKQNIAATALGPSWEDRSRSEDSGKKQHLCTTSERRVMKVLSEQ